MKIFLDDERQTPPGWVRCYWPDEVIDLLHTDDVTDVSLDHDLGDDERGTGYDVLLWIEEAVGGRGWTPPALFVHSANSPARMRMQAAIAQISKLAADFQDNTKHRAYGNFLHDWLGGKPAWYAANPDAPVLLEHSAHISTFFELGEGIALGVDNSWKCYRQEFLEAGWRRPLVSEPMALWELGTGRQLSSLHGHHFGPVAGAAILDDDRLASWGRDYLLRVWDRHDGTCKAVMPLPLFADPQSHDAFLSARAFSQLSLSEKQRYIAERHLPAPDVRLDWIVMPGTEQYHFACPSLASQKTEQIAKWVPGIGRDTDHGAHRIKDLEGAEAGYSTWHLLDDGRLLGGGTTYGTSGQIYVWDGLFDLRILTAGRASINLELVGEVEPNIIEMREITGMDTEDVYRFEV